ncbi:hypothetical protein COCOBI_08-4660 [Coccomyxa sp. Obi]|nr:hypothetical protein COCOBI_08-4660 [Coccomyxa sp. Obi]
MLGSGPLPRQTNDSPDRNQDSINIRSLVKKVVEARDDEVDTLLKGFAALFCILGSYFLLLPIRDEAGVALGTNQLPYLFVGSFVLTLIITPLVSQFLVRPGVTPDKAVRQLYRLLALSLLGFYIAYQATPLTAQPESHGQQGRSSNDSALLLQADQHASREHRSLLTAAHYSTVGRSRSYEGESGGHREAELEGSSEGVQALTGRSLQHRSVRIGDSSLSTPQRVVRMAFFLWLSVVNLVGLSTMWARMADVFGSEAGTRLFGFLGAGATCGQLAGSLVATVWASALRSRGGSGAQIVAPMLVSAAALEVAGRIASRLRRLSPVQASPGKSRSPLARQRQHVGAQLWRSFARLWEGFKCIAASRYLTHLSTYIVFTTAIASLMYFEKSMVVSSAASDAASRMALFGSINSASAFVIALLQLAATGRLLKHLGLATALALSPTFAAALMVGIAVSPTPLVVASGEVLRKVLGYALAKPAREVLFTVVPREDMYKAKICIDTLVVRAGDMFAAALFHFLDGQHHLGPSGCAAFAFPICLGCSAVAYSLGRKQEQLARLQQF